LQPWQQEQQANQLRHVLLLLQLVNPVAHLPLLELATMILQQMDAERGHEVEHPLKQYAELMEQALQRCSSETVEGLPKLLLMDHLFEQSPGEWWSVNGCAFSEQQQGQGQDREESKQLRQREQEQEGKAEQMRERKQEEGVGKQQQQQEQGAASSNSSSGEGVSAQPPPSKKGLGMRGVSLPTVTFSPGEPCDWCRGPCSSSSNSGGGTQQQQQQQEGTAVAAGAVAYGCSLCGLARYCCEGCAKAAQPCHDKNCW
jgi:hypothetical protein